MFKTILQNKAASPIERKAGMFLLHQVLTYSLALCLPPHRFVRGAF